MTGLEVTDVNVNVQGVNTEAVLEEKDETDNEEQEENKNS